MRVALAGAIVVVAVTVVVVLAQTGGGSGVHPAHRSFEGELRSGVLVRAPRQVAATCRRAAAHVPMPARCPWAIPAPDGGWGRARDLIGDACGYLVDVEPGAARGQPGAGSLYHLLFGGRCRPFELKTRGGRWPAGGFIRDDLRLVGRRPLRPGESADQVDAYGFAPARPRVLARLRLGAAPALLLAYPQQPLTTVHSGHLALVWNESEAGYVVSGHATEPAGAGSRRRAIVALRAMALVMRSRPPAADAGVVRDAVIDGVRRDFRAAAGVPHGFAGCFRTGFRGELTARTLRDLVATRATRGQPKAARALNALGVAVGDSCGGREWVPQLTAAAAKLRVAH